MHKKSKGISWVESIYQTFETVCEDFDTNVSSAKNQAPMKYVGNPVNSVGKSVKKLYSSVMQDLLPPVNSENDEARKASLEESDYIEGFIDSRTLEENEFYMNDEQPVGAACGVNQGTVISLQSCSSVERQESNISETDLFGNIFDSGMHAVTTPDAPSQMNASCFSSTSGITSSHTVEKPQSDPDHEYEHIEKPSDGSDASSSPDAFLQIKVSSHSAITEQTSSPMVEKPQSDPNHEFEHIDTPCDGSDKSLTFESNKGEFTLSTKISEDALPKSTKPQSVNVLDNPTNAKVSKPVGKSEQNESFLQANYLKCFTISSNSNSYDIDPFKVGESDTLSCSSGSLGEQGWGSSTLESSMMFSDICISDDSSDQDPPAEVFSVDDIKLIQPDLYTKRHTQFSSSHRRPSLKSYKKLLKDTLNSKKRLVKEYKQLGIWHGDIYEEHESTTTTSSSTQPATHSSSKDVTIPSQNLSEWELL